MNSHRILPLTSVTHSFFAVALLLIVAGCKSPTDYTDNVNPFIGTDFTGNTYPGAQAPFGMVQLSPDNGLPGWDRIAGYFYPDSTIAGFSHTHLSGTGAGDLYDISFMPVTLPYKAAKAPLGIYSGFTHDDETASAGYYRVLLKEYNIEVELTATPRCGIQRYTFPKAQSAIFLNLKKATNWDSTDDSYIQIVDSVTIQGYRYSEGWARGQRVYFHTRFSRPFDKFELDTTAIYRDSLRVGTAYVARFDFQTDNKEQILINTALSGVSMEGAAKNLQREVPENDFDKYLTQTKADWDKQLRVIEIKTEDNDARTSFYTALYHTMIAPTLFCDVDSSYYGPDKQTHKAEDFVNYSTFSLWDTYRASHPLFTYTQPKRINDIVKSFIAFYEQNGRLPVWNLYGSETDMMIGYHAVAIISEAYQKAIGDFDAEKALEACIATANRDEYREIGIYKQLGYIPYNVAGSENTDNWSVSKTLEYAFDDYCIARMAHKMGKKEIADEFYQRANHYKNLFNPATSFMQPRDDKGAFIADFQAEEYTPHFCESNGWQYLWSVQHDIPGLIQLLGGKEAFARKLDTLFTHQTANKEKLPVFSTGMIGQYVHGNEPSHHVAYLFNAADQPWKTQKYVAQVMHEFYKNQPAGLCGNDDCGQMSAWYVFSAMGFYPVNPISGRYEIGSPLFAETKLHLVNGKTFTVLAHNVSKENIYIQSVKVNGKFYLRSYITHEQIMNGSTFEFEMGNKPGPVWYK